MEQRGRTSRSITSRLHGDLAGDSGRCVHCGVLAGIRAEWYLSRARRVLEAWISGLGASRVSGAEGSYVTIHHMIPGRVRVCAKVIVHDFELRTARVYLYTGRARYKG